MLGSMTVSVLSEALGADSVVTTSRSERAPNHPRGTTWRPLEILSVTEADLELTLEGCNWVVNAIGRIKPTIDESSAESVRQAILVNSLFPHRLARLAESAGMGVIQIATDCVYSGTRRFPYSEESIHDPEDVYGRTKSLGEVRSDAFTHLRCSIIGPEAGAGRSLLAWFLSNPANAQLRGFTNHRWNGITTLAFARVCLGIIDNGGPTPAMHHLIPDGEVTKHESLLVMQDCYDRADLSIEPFEAGHVIDRRLMTVNHAVNAGLWKAAGYEAAPDIPGMVSEMADYHRAHPELWPLSEGGPK